MELDPTEYAKSDHEQESAQDKRKSRLNAYVAVTIALLATFMGMCKVKDDNIVQAMQAAQAKSVDDWSYYQSRNIRQLVGQSAADTLRLQSLSAPPNARAAYAKTIQSYQTLADDQGQKKQQTQKDALADGRQYDALNFHDDQFDLSDALLSIAISLLALTALTQKKWLYALALIPTFFGVLMGLAGLLGWRLHPDALTRLLS